MTLSNKTLVAALFAAAIPLYAGPAAAASLSPSLALSNSDLGTVEHVQYRRWDRSYNGGYYAYGAAPDAYYSYGAAPGYVTGPRYGYWNNYGNGGSATAPGSSPRCPSDLEEGSAFPSWMCR